MHRFLISLLLALGLSSLAPITYAATPDEGERLTRAAQFLDEVMRMPERAIPRTLFHDAYAIAVIPDVVKASLVVGGRHGKGVISIKLPDGTWSTPSFMKLSGGSVGFQAGVQSTDVVLVFRSARGVDSIVDGKFTLGADAGVAAGPVGRYAQASTDGGLKAEIYSYSRSRGLFAGVALGGAVLSIDDRANARAFGPNTTARAAFEGRTRQTPAAVVDFRDRLEEYSAE
ncbi:MAG: lipid-binding SYLF domain-containing protein [Xanthomonadales bacterium]|nr:lipid-binding SYLF domain-containing protein [Xanthomonadales bacterium]